MLLFGFAEETNKIDRDSIILHYSIAHISGIDNVFIFRLNHDHITIVEQKESKFK